MSGGHFNGNNYIYYQVYQFADELENDIENNNRPDEYGSAINLNEEALNYLKSKLPEIRQMADIMRTIDYLYSGDHSEDSFLRIVKDLENKKYILAQKVIEAMPKCTLCYKQIATRYEVFDEYDRFSEAPYKEHVYRCDECGPRINELDYAKELREYLKLMR